jgi:hypothetical protein
MFHHNVSSFDERKQIDKQKSQLCKESGIHALHSFLNSTKGITLIEVPFWWDRKYSSLSATVYSQRPDLFSEPPKGTPIPTSPPSMQQALKIEKNKFRFAP